MKDGNNDLYYIDDHAGTPCSFVGFVHILSDQTATSLKTTGLVAYSVSTALVNDIVPYRRWLMENWPSLADLPLSQFGTTVNGEAESQLEKDSAHFWIMSAGELLSEACLTPFKHHNLSELIISLIHYDMSDLLHLFMSVEEHLFSPPTVQVYAL